MAESEFLNVDPKMSAGARVAWFWAANPFVYFSYCYGMSQQEFDYWNIPSKQFLKPASLSRDCQTGSKYYWYYHKGLSSLVRTDPRGRKQ